MNLSAIIILAFGMAMDAFAASISKGATLYKPKFSEALRTGIIFGVVEAITPLIGWFLGSLANDMVMSWNHYIAFFLLTVLGARMILSGIRNNMPEPEVNRHGFWLLVATAIATSLDGMAVGVGLAFLQVNILQTIAIIGCTTTIMTIIGVMIGRFIGPLFGKRAEVLGGIVLIGIGCQIFL